MKTYTFIIPHKNCPELLARCVDSIPEREDVQIIIVDDNSDEGKKPSIDREGVEIILLDADHSKGAGHARNVGLQHAKGKWLLFADADDFYTPEMLSVLDKYSSTDIDVLYFDYRAVNVDGTLSKHPYSLWLTSAKTTPKDLDRIKFMHYAPWNKMINMEMVYNHQIRFEETKNGNDMFFTLQVGWFAKKIQIDYTPIYRYVYQQGSLVNNRKKTSEEIISKLLHREQMSEFRIYLGYPEIKESGMFHYLLSCLRSGGLLYCFDVAKAYLVCRKKIKNEKYKFVEYFKKHLQ